MARFQVPSVASLLAVLAGAALGPEFQLHTYVTGAQFLPQVALDADGDFVTTWTTFFQDASGDISARRFKSAGTPQAVEFRVNTYATGAQYGSKLAIDSDGDFVIAWQSLGQDGSDYGVFAQRFKASGGASGSEFRVNAEIAGKQYRPALASDADGDFAVAWSNALGGDGNDVFARRYDVLSLFDIDGDGQLLPLTDGLLVLRFAFGFSGNVLITGAVGPGCTRCDVPSITAYLQSFL